MTNTVTNHTTRWEKMATDLLVGRTILEAFYMTAEEADETGFYGRPVVLVLDNGMQLIPQADDEGNDGGALLVADAARAHVLPLL